MVKKQTGFRAIKSVLRQFDDDRDKYISREYQAYGVMLAQELDDEKHKSLYIKMARDLPRALLEQARRFVKDANARSKARLFMWKLKQLRQESEKSGSDKKSKSS